MRIIQIYKYPIIDHHPYSELKVTKPEERYFGYLHFSILSLDGFYWLITQSILRLEIYPHARKTMSKHKY
jgi:hypothetical protein